MKESLQLKNNNKGSLWQYIKCFFKKPLHVGYLEIHVINSIPQTQFHKWDHRFPLPLKTKLSNTLTLLFYFFFFSLFCWLSSNIQHSVRKLLLGFVTWAPSVDCVAIKQQLFDIQQKQLLWIFTVILFFFFFLLLGKSEVFASKLCNL